MGSKGLNRNQFPDYRFLFFIEQRIAVIFFCTTHYFLYLYFEIYFCLLINLFFFLYYTLFLYLHIEIYILLLIAHVFNPLPVNSFSRRFSGYSLR